MILNLKQPVLSVNSFESLSSNLNIFNRVDSIEYEYTSAESFLAYLNLLTYLFKRRNNIKLKVRINIYETNDLDKIFENNEYSRLIANLNLKFECYINYFPSKSYDRNLLDEKLTKWLKYLYPETYTFLVINLFGDFSFNELDKILITFKEISAFNSKSFFYCYIFKNKLNFPLYKKITNLLTLKYSEAGCQNCPHRNVIKNNSFYFCEKLEGSRISLNSLKKERIFYIKYSFWNRVTTKLNAKYFDLRTGSIRPNKNGCFLFGKYASTLYNFGITNEQ